MILSPSLTKYWRVLARLERETGRPPTLREIMRALGQSSTDPVCWALYKLEERGLAERRTPRGWRTWRIKSGATVMANGSVWRMVIWPER